MIQDSGNRRTFDTGAVRDIQEGKGREDLLPLKIISAFLDDEVIFNIASGKIFIAMTTFCKSRGWTEPEAIMEVARHFEAGALKYGENNWQKGIPTHSYIDSAIRHYLKWLDGWDDEPHDRAFLWNCLCYLWTKENKPELDDWRPDGI